MISKRSLISAALVVMCTAACLAYAQEKPADAIASVPALDSFHEVIFKIWHEAWPKKDAAMLRQLLPTVEKGIAQVSSAPLPGILRERRSAWDEGLRKLQAAGAEYRNAAVAKDDTALLAAAEKLHGQFEALMRVTRPALKELDEFHAVLYMLYHYYLPKYEIQNIRSSASELKQKMAALNSAKLPERLKEKEAQFLAARNRLSASVNALETSIQTNVEQKIKDAVNELHSNYQALDRVFQ